jgi:hypothetical protein
MIGARLGGLKICGGVARFVHPLDRLEFVLAG